MKRSRTALARRVYDASVRSRRLSRAGTSRVDAEIIVAELMRKTVACALDAYRAGVAQRVEFHQLSIAGAESTTPTVPPVTPSRSGRRAARRACSMTALTQAGIPRKRRPTLFSRQSRRARGSSRVDVLDGRREASAASK